MNPTIEIPRDVVTKWGRWLMSGALSEFSRFFMIGFAALLILAVGLDLADHIFHVGPYDDTDARWGEHSGLRSRRDALTGCEYLESSDGALTPRLRADGHQVCR